MNFLISILYFSISLSAISSTMEWDYEPVSWTRSDTNSAWVTDTSFKVYYSRDGSNWTHVATTTNQFYTINQHGWWGVSAQAATNETEKAELLLPFRIVRVGTLSIGGGRR